MNFAAAILAPFTLLLSAVGMGEEVAEAGDPSSAGEASLADDLPASRWVMAWHSREVLPILPEAAQQVHIEQRMTIRVSPRDMRTSVPQRGPRLVERKMGKCLPLAGIAGVEPNGPNSLILFMRDRRMIGVELDRSCHSRAFYSGFYLSRTSDGKVCVDRDTLLSRSGSACKLSRIRELVEED